MNLSSFCVELLKELVLLLRSENMATLAKNSIGSYVIQNYAIYKIHAHNFMLNTASTGGEKAYRSKVAYLELS